MGQSVSIQPSSKSILILTYPNFVAAGQLETLGFPSEEPQARLLEGKDWDYSLEIPDECLALIFQSLSSGDRKRCSLVCRRWFIVEGQTRHRLSLNCKADFQPHIVSVFSRFDSITKLALRCDRKSASINDEGLAIISLRCRNLTRLKIRGCREITDLGLSFISKNCKTLKKFSCNSCMFGAKGMNALLAHSSSLEELSVKRLRGGNDGVLPEPIGPGAASSSLKSICLKELYNGLNFGPLIIESKKLKTLKLLRCLGDWDRILEALANRQENHLFEIHLERLQVSDFGLRALSKCSELEILHLMKALDCTNSGIIAVAEGCKLLRKLHIDGWKSDKIDDEGLIAIAKYGVNIQELVLIGLNPSSVSMSAIASKCKKLERLALCGSETIKDAEISYFAEKCLALRKLCIKGCEVTDKGIETFAWGCPNLVKIKIKKCKGVTREVAEWLRWRRASLTVSLDVEEVEVEAVEVSASDGFDQEEGAEGIESVEFPPGLGRVIVVTGASINSDAAPFRENVIRPSTLKSSLGVFGGRSVGCTFVRWLNGNGSSSD